LRDGRKKVIGGKDFQQNNLTQPVRFSFSGMLKHRKVGLDSLRGIPLAPANIWQNIYKVGLNPAAKLSFR
jgi:hypothetical protein